MSIFLHPDDVAYLTGYDQKSYQIEYLRSNGIFHHVNAGGHPDEYLRSNGIFHHVNAGGHPVVPISAAEGREAKVNNSQEWQPAVLNHGQKTNR